MYKVYCDNYLIYTPLLDNLNLVDPSAKLELNKAGELTFGIMTTHPYFNQLQRIKSIITLKDDNDTIFRGRIINDDTGFYNDKEITCEGELAFLNDSIQRPYSFTGTPAELFTQFITNHNTQVDAEHQFKVGNITVTDPNNYITRSDTGYSNTWECINSKLITLLGGYLWVRHEETGIYIDYLVDFSTLNLQKIQTGVNLLSFKKTVKGEDIATAIIPLGAKLKNEEGNDTDDRLTIASVNNGLDYVSDPTAVAEYGLIYKVIEWDDVTVADNLLTKATAYLATAINLQGSIEITALDLAATNGDTSFRIGSYIKTDSPQHGIDNESFLIQKLDISISNPANNKLTLDSTFSTFTDKQVATENAIKNIQLTPGPKGEDAYRLDIISTQGNIFKNGEIVTTLLARVYKGSSDVTDLYNAARFRWTRTSIDSLGDTQWNTSHFGGVKQINVTKEDVYLKATFNCELLEA